MTNVKCKIQYKSFRSCYLLPGMHSPSGGGFTLLEILIALAILSGLLVTLIYTINYQLGLIDRQETITTATLLAKSKLNDLERKPENVKGKFDPPYDRYVFETFVKESPYIGISEIIVVIKSGSEEVKLNEFVFK